MKAQRLKNIKKQNIKKQKNASPKRFKKQVDLLESIQQKTSQLENYKSFFQYLLSDDIDDELVDES